MARRLRREQGLSIKEIERRLGVSRSSVSLWVRDIELTREQQLALLDRNPAYNRQRAGQEAYAAICRDRRRGWQDEGRELACAGDLLHVAGCMLFWAEGSRDRNVVKFTNSDPAMATFFVNFLRGCFDLSNDAIRIDCNLFADHAERQREIEDFWLETLGLPKTCLRKTIVNVYSKYSQKKRRNRLPYGTVRINVHSTRVAQHIYGAIQHYAGFDRPEWLD
jgi:transcriptional regulator with XRE-family HTH domain